MVGDSNGSPKRVPFMETLPDNFPAWSVACVQEDGVMRQETIHNITENVLGLPVHIGHKGKVPVEWYETLLRQNMGLRHKVVEKGAEIYKLYSNIHSFGPCHSSHTVGDPSRSSGHGAESDCSASLEGNARTPSSNEVGFNKLLFKISPSNTSHSVIKNGVKWQKTSTGTKKA